MSMRLRKHAESLIGQYIYVYHHDGSVFHGTLHSVNQYGIYLMNAQPADLVASSTREANVVHSLNDTDNQDVEVAFFPFFFLPFAALAGVAAASALRPPYPYPYPYYGYGPGYYY